SSRWCASLVSGRAKKTTAGMKSPITSGGLGRLRTKASARRSAAGAAVENPIHATRWKNSFSSSDSLARSRAKASVWMAVAPMRVMYSQKTCVRRRAAMPNASAPKTMRPATKNTSAKGWEKLMRWRGGRRGGIPLYRVAPPRGTSRHEHLDGLAGIARVAARYRGAGQSRGARRDRYALEVRDRARREDADGPAARAGRAVAAVAAVATDAALAAGVVGAVHRDALGRGAAVRAFAAAPGVAAVAAAPRLDA